MNGAIKKRGEKMKKNYTDVILLAIIFGLVSGVLGSYFIVDYKMDSQAIPETPEERSDEEIIGEWYRAETLVHVSPHHIRKHMGQEDSDFILVDLRSQEEYEKEHVIGAVNIPAYKNPFKSAYGDVERITMAFRDLIDKSEGKDIIVYCYSIPCMTGRKVGNMLAEHGMYVKHLGVGWNEWRYFWTMWNHEHEWAVVNAEDYVVSGPEPGTTAGTLTASGCPLGGEFGC